METMLSIREKRFRCVNQISPRDDDDDDDDDDDEEEDEVIPA